MPLQRYDTRVVPRPAGMVPPVADLGGITELRLHGVGGTTPEDLLGDSAPQHVSGDRIAGFYRTADLPDRHVEAYSWGGLTSRSGTRVLWLLLFPFALANVAGWMCAAGTHACPLRFRLHRTAVRWAALALTLNLILLCAITAMELLAYRCGDERACTANLWPLGWLADPPLADHPGRRLLIGALAPLGLVVLLAILTLRSISRYESTRPPWRTNDPPPRQAYSSAQPGLGLADPTFWDGRRSSYDLGCLHIAAGLAFVALTLAYTAHSTTHQAGSPVVGSAWLLAAVCLGGATTLAALVFLVPDRCRTGIGHLLLATGTGSLLCAGWFAAIQPRSPQPRSLQPLGHLPGMPDVADLTLGGVLATLLLVLVTAVLGGRRAGTFFVFGPFVALTLAVFALNLVLLSVMSWVAGPVEHPGVYLYPIVARLVPYLALLALTALLGFTAYELITYWRAGADRQTRNRIRAWYRDNSPCPDDEDRWRYNAVENANDDRWTVQVARARRFARMPRDLDKLLTIVAGSSSLLLVTAQARYWIFDELPWDNRWLFTAGSALAASAPVALILLLRRGWRNLHSRRRIGVLWDILTFWPRAYHPLAPPAYSERAVPELQRRLWRIHEYGGRVVLASHSQGTIIATAALLQPDNRPNDDVVTLVTFGSPLRTLYGWAFPAYFNDTVLRRLVSPDGASGAQVYAWRNFYYLTDYIGGPVFGAEPTDVDVELPDPRSSWYIFGQPKPAPTRHGGYWNDPAMWVQVDRLAAAAAGAPRIPRQSSASVPRTTV